MSKANEKTCPKVDENKKNCPCASTSCPRHGTCCECIAYHRSQGNKPACMR